jgi:hypothetical protein
MNNLAGAIGLMLEDSPVSSCKVLCRRFWIGTATRVQILHDMLDLQTVHLRWVADAPSINQNREKVLYSKLFSF